MIMYSRLNFSWLLWCLWVEIRRPFLERASCFEVVRRLPSFSTWLRHLGWQRWLDRCRPLISRERNIGRRWYPQGNALNWSSLDTLEQVGGEPSTSVSNLLWRDFSNFWENLLVQVEIRGESHVVPLDQGLSCFLDGLISYSAHASNFNLNLLIQNHLF